MDHSPQKILIIKLRAIGDVIMATPVIANLRSAFPAANIDFLTERPSAAIVEDNPDLNRVIVLDRTALKQQKPVQRLQTYLRFIADLRQQNYDLVFDLFGNPRSALLTLLTRAPVRAGYRYRIRRFAYTHVVEPRGDRVHEVQTNLDALQALHLPISNTELRVAIDDVSANEIEQFWQQNGLPAEKLVIGLNASGGWYTKRWPLHSFAQLGDRLRRESGARLLLLWGPGEREDATSIQRMMSTESVMAPTTTLKSLGVLLRRLHLLVSNDSGPMHLAAAVGTPVVGIYGPTNPRLQGPWGNQNEVVTKTGLDCLGCNGVTCRIVTHDCMQALSVDEVMAAIRKLIHRIQGG